MSYSFAIVKPNNTVEKVVVWDGESEWSPCHEDDSVILVLDDNAVPGGIHNGDGTFSRPEPEVVE